MFPTFQTPIVGAMSLRAAHPCFIFDFDGTIAASESVILRICNDLSDKYGFTPLGPAEHEAARDLPIRALMAGRGLSLYKVPRLILEVQATLRREIASTLR